jgi:hypothetical protein
MLKKGDRVVITDGSWAVCVSKKWNKETEYEIAHPSLWLAKEEFEVVKKKFVPGNQKMLHDIFIKSTLSGEVYVHSSNMVKKVEKDWFQGAKRKDRFTIDGDEYILSHSGNCYMSLISLTNGNCWNTAIKCKNSYSITKEEFKQLTSLGALPKEVYLTKH